RSGGGPRPPRGRRVRSSPSSIRSARPWSRPCAPMRSFLGGSDPGGGGTEQPGVAGLRPHRRPLGGRLAASLDPLWPVGIRARGRGQGDRGRRGGGGGRAGGPTGRGAAGAGAGPLSYGPGSPAGAGGPVAARGGGLGRSR